MDPGWLENARRLQAIAQTGIAFAKDPFDLERYEEVARIALKLLADLAEEAPFPLTGLPLADMGYATPKVDVRGVVFKEERILLVKEMTDGCWALPGGWADVGEAPSESVVKEIREEAGLEVRPTKLLAVYDRDKHGHSPHPNHVYKLFFLCTIVGGTPQNGTETRGVGFFPENELPELSIDRVTASQIQRMFEHLRVPRLPTDFD
jgi:ADP-ribose pyrophosphatase YjhB (NUDIX family)